MSIQQKLIKQRESTNIVTCSYTINYLGFYIHGANYNGVHICYVQLIGCACYYSKSIEQVKKRIRQFKKDFNI